MTLRHLGATAIGAVMLGASLASCSDPCTKADGYRTDGYEACLAQGATYREMYAESKAEAASMQGLTDEEMARYEIEQEFFLSMEVAYETHCGSLHNDCAERKTQGCLKASALETCESNRIYSQCILDNVLNQGFSEEAKGHTCTHLLSSSKTNAVQ